MIEVEHLTKSYGGRMVVDDLTFTAATGRVTGFLGPNGAGKSTTLRMLCGLAPADSGRALVDGRPFKQIPVPGREVGVMLDASAQHAGRTGLETLTLVAMATGTPRAQVLPMLERVGLADAGRKRVGAYSLGMRQRLGLAGALMASPSTLILDEPANGLDPEGIHWMRSLLRDFADEGGTVLLSSHLLSEVQHIADDIVVLANGRLVTAGSTDELLATAGDAHLVDATDRDGLVAALRASGLPAAPAGGVLRVEASAARIGELALGHRLVLTRLEPVRNDLESTFLQLTAAA